MSELHNTRKSTASPATVKGEKQTGMPEIDKNNESTEMPESGNNDSNTLMLIIYALSGGCAAFLVLGIIVGVVISKKKTGRESHIETQLQPTSNGTFTPC